MVELNFDVDASAVGDSSFGPIPAGNYDGEIVAADVRVSGAGHNYLSVQVKIEGRGSVWDNLNLWHPSAGAVEIAQRKLNEIGVALGLGNIGDTDQLVAKRVKVSVGFQKSDPTRNEIKTYSSPASAASPAQAVPPSAAAPAPPPAGGAAPAWRG